MQMIFKKLHFNQLQPKDLLLFKYIILQSWLQRPKHYQFNAFHRVWLQYFIKPIKTLIPETSRWNFFYQNCIFENPFDVPFDIITLYSHAHNQTYLTNHFNIPAINTLFEMFVFIQCKPCFTFNLNKSSEFLIHDNYNKY